MRLIGGGSVARITDRSCVRPHSRCLAVLRYSASDRDRTKYRRYTGLYQIQVASGMAQAGTSPIWRVNTATGALDFCTFTNVNLSGGSRITCQGSSGQK
jgi:hypothetical protein